MEYEEERLNNLNYKFELEDKYIYVNKNNNKYVVKSPYLKVLKAKHEFKNKNYLIVHRQIYVVLNNYIRIFKDNDYTEEEDVIEVHHPLIDEIIKIVKVEEFIKDLCFKDSKASLIILYFFSSFNFS